MKQKRTTEKNIKFLPAITTTKNSDWKEKIKEIKNLHLKEAAIFPTCLNEKERKELYQLIEKSGLEKIPFVHLRNDMKINELDYLIKNWKTEVFNIHMQVEYPLAYDYSKYKDIIYIENVYHSLDEKELKKFAGICLDFSHLENDRFLKKEKFKHDSKMLDIYQIGCNHISAIKKTTYIDEFGYVRYAFHYLNDFSELDYLKKYPLKYFSSFCAIELENSISEQLKAIEYIKNLLML